MRQSDVKEQINQMYDQRDEKHHWIEDYREGKFNASLKNWFRGFAVRKRKDNVQIVGLFFNVTGEELYRKWDSIITDIDRRLYPVEITGATNGKPIIHLPPNEIKKLEFRIKHFAYMRDHIDRKRTYYLTAADSSDAELIVSQESFYADKDK